MVAATLSRSGHRRARAYAIGRERTTRWVIYAVIAVGVICTLFPVLWMLSNSFKNGMAVYNVPPIWITPYLRIKCSTGWCDLGAIAG